MIDVSQESAKYAGNADAWKMTVTGENILGTTCNLETFETTSDTTGVMADHRRLTKRELGLDLTRKDNHTSQRKREGMEYSIFKSEM